MNRSDWVQVRRCPTVWPLVIGSWSKCWVFFHFSRIPFSLFPIFSLLAWLYFLYFLGSPLRRRRCSIDPPSSAHADMADIDILLLCLLHFWALLETETTYFLTTAAAGLLFCSRIGSRKNLYIALSYNHDIFLATKFNSMCLYAFHVDRCCFASLRLLPCATYLKPPSTDDIEHYLCRAYTTLHSRTHSFINRIMVTACAILRIPLGFTHSIHRPASEDRDYCTDILAFL